MSPDLLQQLYQLLGPKGVVTEGIEQRTTDGWGNNDCLASVILRPTTTQQVSDIMRLCSAEGQKVVTQGGCTNMTHACDTSRDELVISMERMTVIESVDNSNRTMTVQSGVPLQHIQERAESEGLFFALDLGARGSATIGGNIATNAGGNQVIRYGMAREQVLGLEVVLADGRILSSMNQMLKNNAGYDLKHLFIGSEGTLGIVTRAVLRLRSRLPVATTALVATDQFSKMPRLLNHMESALGGKLGAFETLWQSYYRIAYGGEQQTSPPLSVDYLFYILLESTGIDAQQDREQFLAALETAMEQELICDAVLAESQHQQQGLWAVRDNIPSLQPYQPIILFDISLPLSEMENYLEEMEANIREIDSSLFIATLGHLGDGNLHVAVQLGNDQPERRKAVELAVYGPLQQRGGSISGEHGIGLEKKPYLHLCRSEVEIQLMEQLKKLLDPQCLLNCGKVIE